MNIFAKKSRTEDGYFVESVKTYDEDTREIGFFQRMVEYIKEGMGQWKIGKWYRIRKSDYDAEDSPQITYDNHP